MSELPAAYVQRFLLEHDNAEPCPIPCNIFLPIMTLSRGSSSVSWPRICPKMSSDRLGVVAFEPGSMLSVPGEWANSEMGMVPIAVPFK